MKTPMQELLELIPSAAEIKEYLSNTDADEKMLDEWLWERIFKGNDWLLKEKQQIIDAITYGQNNHTVSITSDIEIAEQYYNEQYGG